MYVHGRSADTNLAEIHEEMSELLDKLMNICTNESLFWGSCKLKKACDENERRKKNKTITA